MLGRAHQKKLNKKSLKWMILKKEKIFGSKGKILRKVQYLKKIF